MPDLSGRTAIVAGGATLIGRGVAEALVRAGATVVIADKDSDRGRTTAAEIGAVFCPTDITGARSVAALVNRTAGGYGGIDIVVNLAALYLDLRFDTAGSGWGAALDAKLANMTTLVDAARPHLAASDHASVINFSSISSGAEQGSAASRAAIVRMTWSMAMDLAADGIRVNSVSPGWIVSAVVEGAGSNVVAAPFPLTCRVAAPDNLGNVVAYLASDVAADVTGGDWAPSAGYYAPIGGGRRAPALPKLAM